MEKKIKYIRKEKAKVDVISVVEAYKVYALNNNLPVYNDKLISDGDYFIYLDEEGKEQSKIGDMTFDEMIAKIIFQLFNGKKIEINSRIVNNLIKNGDMVGLEKALVSEFENDLDIEVCKLDGEEQIALRFGRENVLNMMPGTVLYDDKNEIHVAFVKARKSMVDIADGWCK